MFTQVKRGAVRKSTTHRLGVTCLWLVLLLTLAVGQASASTIILDKTPDQGPYWHPLDGNGGTYVYANSFVYTGPTGALLDTVGIYMLSETGGTGDAFFFHVLADTGGDAPDPTTVLGATGQMQVGNASLALVTGTLLSPFALTTGTRYWIAASTAGLAQKGGSYQVGGHTQNSLYLDNGTFWYSNDPAGLAFDGQALTPEMAIYATVQAVPEPATLLLLGAGLGAVAARRRLQKRT